ncbi:MAG: hypothetical protein IJ685_00340 [Selenomonadaceae bacterium]|nr:hypothetical protein [Selenomonadaceae bacterium]
MAFVVKDYGSGALGDVTEISSTVNSYARVTAINATSVTIDTATQVTGTATFTAGAKILLHVSATTSSSYKTYLGNWLLANVTAVNSGVLTLDVNPTTCITSAELAHYYVQAVAVAQYKNLTLGSGVTITPPVYNVTNYNGGIVAIMCSDTLKFDGGHINLTDKGIPVASKALRPTTANDPVDDIDTYSGWENSDTRNHFFLNAGDGAAFIIAKKMTCHANSRIGNTATYGVQFYRGATNSVTYNETAPSNVTNVGGSTILVAAQTIENFTCKMFAKYRSSSLTAGQGICRCYIASETKLRNDEGLYAYDCISNKSRLKSAFGIKNFGNGSFGDLNNVTTQLNNYAKVTAINGNKVTYTGATTDGLAQFAQGAMVMIHWNHKNSTTVAEAGRFFIANVIDEYNGVLTLDATPPNISITNYACQVVAIPQAKNFTLSTTNEATPAFNGTQGGICAIAVSNTCTMDSQAKIHVAVSTVSYAYGRTGLATIGNAQDSNKLPIGQGYGSIFILANNMQLGSALNGQYYNWVGSYADSGYACGGYRGNASSAQITDKNIGGSGANGGAPSFSERGGYGSNGAATKFKRPYQGAHIIIVANKITKFHQAFISTGGTGLSGFSYVSDTNTRGLRASGAGYGGLGLHKINDSTQHVSSGYNGGAGSNSASYYSSQKISDTEKATGGSSGWAFVYCNEVVSQDTTGTVLAN